MSFTALRADASNVNTQLPKLSRQTANWSDWSWTLNLSSNWTLNLSSNWNSSWNLSWNSNSS